MISKISFLTALIFSAIYPLCFWISSGSPLKNNFHRFHIGLPCLIAGVSVICLLKGNFSATTQWAGGIWGLLFLALTALFWGKETFPSWCATILAVLGVIVFSLVENEILIPDLIRNGAIIPSAAVIFAGGILAGIIFCSSLYAMNLGHWYLNVHGLPIRHLMRSVYVFWFFLLIRLIWDLYGIIFLKVQSQGEVIPVYLFMQHMDGFFLWIAVFFGTLMPIVTLYFVRGTLLVKSTQSATGILYVILAALLIGDLTYKYYLIKYGVVL